MVTDNCLENNGEYGYTAEGENGTEHNATLTDNDIASNNAAGYYDVAGSTVQCGCSGGGKFWQTVNATITGNYIHDNVGPGIWVDTANAGFDISRNYIADNWREGVAYEVSYNAKITDNTFVGTPGARRRPTPPRPSRWEPTSSRTTTTANGRPKTSQ